MARILAVQEDSLFLISNKIHQKIFVPAITRNKGNILNGNVAAFYTNNNNCRLQSLIFISDRNTFSKTILQDIFESHKPDAFPEISLQRSSFLDRKVQLATLIYNYLSDHVFK
jgi:hypothetical protein